MKQIKLGGISASAVSLGCMRISDSNVKNPDEIIETALECGINHFDHADIYGGGRSEEIFGDYLKRHPSLRENILVQTKCAIRPKQYDFSKEHIIEAVEGSLKRLNCDYVDYLLLHRPDTLMEPEEVAEAFDKLYSEGKVKNFGVSNHNLYQIELLKTAVKQPIVANQLQFSITECGMVASGLNVNMKNEESVMHDGGLLEYCRIKDITIQTWSPFQAGFFGGSFIGDMEKYPELNKKLQELAEKYSVTPTTIASAWILRHPANMQLLSGTMKAERLKEICKGADITLTRSEWYEVYLAAGYRLP